MAGEIHSDPELNKIRRISFDDLSAAEVADVAEILNDLENVKAAVGEDGSSVVVTYSIAEHKLEELENILDIQGYRLDSHLLERIRLGLIYFSEEIEQDNLHTPLRSPTRDDRLHAIYANARERHLDESAPLPPEELSNYF